MKFAAIFVATFLCGLTCVSADAGEHPVVKVISMLKDLEAKAIQEGKDEEVQFSKFSYWCKTSTATVKAAISDENEALDQVKSELASLEKERNSLKAQIDELTNQISDKQAAAKASKDNREHENDLYKDSDKHFGSTIKAMEAALSAMGKAEASTEGGGALKLAQTHVRSMLSFISIKASEQEVRTLTDFASSGPDVAAEGDLSAHVDKYDFKSENVVELLKSLRIKFQNDRLENNIEETNSQNSYNLEEQARDNAIEALEKSKKAATADLKAAEKDTAEKEGDQKNLKADLKADTKTRDDTEEMCNSEKNEWDTRSKTRSLEIASMNAAVKILGKATGVRTEAPNNPVPPASPVSFLQSLATHEPASDPKMKAVALIRQAGKEAHSKALERLAVEVSAHLNGHFDDMNAMVEKMIFRLMHEQKEDDEHKLWCDKEMSKSNAMKDDKLEKLKELNAEIKVENAQIQSLTDDIEDASKMVADIDRFMKEASEIRATGKMENNLALKDSRDAQTALTNAVGVLRSFYKESGEIEKESWEFIQKAPVKLGKSPEQWDSGYTAVADPAKQPGGIISVLETISSDFAKMEADTMAQESVDQKEFDETMKANKIEKARRAQEQEMKEAEKKRRVEKSNSLKSTKKDTTAQLDKTNQYLTDLKPACGNGDSTYESRKAARTKETVALREAQQTLLDAFKEKPVKKSKKFMQIQPVM